MSYVELHSRSAFSFLRGASLPEHLAEVAAQLELPAMALCDRDGVSGVPRFFNAAKTQGVRPIIGSELTMEDGTILPVLVETRLGYQNLCRLITRAQLRAPKGHSAVRWNELPEFTDGLVALTGDIDGPLHTAILNQSNRRETDEPTSFGVRWQSEAATPLSFEGSNHADSKAVSPFRSTTALQKTVSPDEILSTLVHAFGHKNVFVEIQRHHLRGEDRVNTALIQLARAHRLPLLATNGVLYGQPHGREVLDVFTCIRNHTHLDAAGRLLAPNGERYLKLERAMRELFADVPEAIDNTSRLAERLQFSLENLGYEFPRYPIADGESPDSYLRKQTYLGARKRYRDLNARVTTQLEHELDLIAKLGFAGYFLIVWDIINFCRDSDIMVQGRGSAANSAVCYSLGITAVDPVSSDLLFERFLSEGRKGWPDIDLDLPSGDRREQAIQEVYRRYGRHGAAMTANVITYRGRSAAREIGKALNFSTDVLDRFSHLFGDGGFPHTLDVQSQLKQSGVGNAHPRAQPFISLYQSIYGLPRHLGQHSGGMIICQGQLDSIVPLENASMPGRTVAQWDKEDCEDLGIVKVDLLGLGMMSVIQDALELTRQRGHPVELAQIPKDDPATFKIMQEADTIGVFQIESRAQMATLPRMKPRSFYDVVIEVAIIRPGPIQGDMVHPYLARRAGREPVDYIDPRLEPVLARTLGIPLFQEQMLKIAMVMADFTGNEAEELRRALSFHRSEERMRKVSVKLRERMQAKGIAVDAIERIIQSISSFALYGFPESHAISFAILAYGSAYLKAHYGPEFYASLLNNQPMGFYAPATLVKDGRRHGVRFRPVCAMRSDWRCIIEPDNSVRLGFCVVRGLRQPHAERILQSRHETPFASLEDFQSRTTLNKDELRVLAEIGAFNCFAAHRRDALWQVEKPPKPDELFAEKTVAALAGKGAVEEPLFVESLFDFARRQKRLTANAGESEQNVSAMHDAPAPTSFGIGHSSFSSSPLFPMNAMERLRADFNGMDLTTGPHPMSLIRSELKDVWRAIDLPKGQHGQYVRIAGNVICRQRPGTAKGFVFISLEDETGVSNAIVNPQMFEEHRLVITQEPFLVIEGDLQNLDNVVTVKARRIAGLHYTELVGSSSHDFH